MAVFFVWYFLTEADSIVLRCIAPVTAFGGVDLRLALQTGVCQAQHRDDACGGEAKCKGANPAGLERAELGDKAHGCHRSRSQPFAGGRQQQTQMECAVSAAEQIDGGDRNRDIFFIGFNDRCGGNNGGATADGGANTDQHGQLAFDADKPGQIPGRQNDGGDDERGARQYAHPEHQEVVEIQSRAEEDDAQRQDSLDHEVRTGSELPG